jgi:hypothetical protein
MGTVWYCDTCYAARFGRRAVLPVTVAPVAEPQLYDNKGWDLYHDERDDPRDDFGRDVARRSQH